MSIPFLDNGVDAKTDAAVKDPQVGDRFTEMFSFWLYVVGRDGDAVITLEGNAPCVMPRDGRVHIQTVAQFEKRLSYGGNTPGYWVRLCDRNRDVDGWISVALQKIAADLDDS